MDSFSCPYSLSVETDAQVRPRAEGLMRPVRSFSPHACNPLIQNSFQKQSFPGIVCIVQHIRQNVSDSSSQRSQKERFTHVPAAKHRPLQQGNATGF